MAYYLILCFLGMVLFMGVTRLEAGTPLGQHCGFYLAVFFLAFFIRPWYIFDIGYFNQFYQFGVHPFKVGG